MIAGGKSSRFGSDKALALLGGKPLIEHAADAIHNHIDALVVCGRAYRDWTSLPDLRRPGLGPLGGIAAALDYASTIGADRILTIACDMPGISPESIEVLVKAAPSFCANAPVLGCWPASYAKPTLALLADCSGDRGPAIRGWALDMGAKAVAVTTPRNVNTSADLAAL